MDNNEEKISIDARNILSIELTGDRRRVKVTTILDFDEFERDIWSSAFLQWKLPFSEIKKCNGTGCDGKYALIGGKTETGMYCFDCCNSDSGKGYYCEQCYESYLMQRNRTEWACRGGCN